MSKLDKLQNKLDMWQRTATLYGSINVTLTLSDVVQLHQDVAVLYARIAELEADNAEFRQLIRDWSIVLEQDDFFQLWDVESVRQAMLEINKEREE